MSKRIARTLPPLTKYDPVLDRELICSEDRSEVRLERQWRELRWAQGITAFCILVAFALMLWTLNHYLPQPLSPAELQALTGAPR